MTWSWPPFRHRPVLVGAAAAGLLLLVAAPLFFLRGVGTFDDSVLLKFGEMLLDGAAPYRDFVDNKPPGNYLLAAALLWLGDGSFWVTPRLFLYGTAVAFVLIVGGHVRRHFGATAAMYAMPLAAAGHVMTQGYSLHTETPAAFFGLLATALLASGTGRRTLIGAGALYGLAMLFKQTSVMFLAGALVWLLALRSTTALSGRLRQAGLVLLGYGAVGALTLLAAAAAGILQPMLAGTLGGAVTVIERTPWAPRHTLRLLFMVPAIPLMAMVLLLRRGRGVEAPSAERRPTDRNGPLGLWSAVLAATLLPALRVDNATGHYIALPVAAASIVCAVLLARRHASRSAASRLARAAWVGALVLWGAAFLYGGARMIGDGRLPRDLQATREMRAALATVADPAEPVYAFAVGTSPRLYLMSGRPPAVPYLHHGLNLRGRFDLHSAARYLVEVRPRLVITELPDGPMTDFGVDAILGPRLEALAPYYDVVWEAATLSPVTGRRERMLVRRAPGG